MFTLTIGNGIGFVYACPRAAAMKWFHPSKKGLVNGLVVAGFGLGALWLAPLEIYFLKKLNWSLELTLQVLGVLILILGTIAALNVKNPPAGYHYPEIPVDPNKPLKENQKKSASIGMATVAKSPQAWMLFFVYAFYCSAGAMVISNASDIMRVQSGGEEGPYGADRKDAG
jgi:OFA family oxalate/formate antiporter-like MFS transporter